jgi:acetyl-CoA C-acetyltransferase
MARRCAIVGVGETKCATHRKEIDAPGMVNEAVTKALADADLTIADIDAVVFGQAPDAFTGVANAEKWNSGAAGALHKPMMRVHTGGATGTGAAICGFTHVASGMFDTVLVVSAERIKESENAQYILNTIWDPIYEQNMELNTITIVAIFAAMYMKEYDLTMDHLSRVAVKNRENAINNPYAHIQKPLTMADAANSPLVSWPLRLCDVCPSSDGSCAIIIASEDKAKKTAGQPAWITGVSQIGDTVFVGDRMRLGDEKRLTENIDLSAQKAYQMAGITDPRHQIDVAEIYAPFTIMEIMIYERFGFCARGQGGRFVEQGITTMSGDLPVTPSGGTLCSNPIAATGLYRVADAANQIRGTAGPIQVLDVKTALAHGQGGSGQFSAVMILQNTPS